MTSMPHESRNDGGLPANLGERLRSKRQEVGISLRELARRVNVSASLVSQIETGKVQPSVNTLYALVTELDGSLDDMLFGEPPAFDKHTNILSGLAPLLLAHPPSTGVQRGDDRMTIRLNKGIRWERLTPLSAAGLEFLYVVYEPGAESSPADAYQRHPGREWAYIISGTLHLAVGFDEHVLGSGDSITYDSSTPHRLHNPGDSPVEAVWFQLG